MADTIQILHVDDDPDMTDLTAAFLENHDERFSITAETSVGDGLARLAGDDFDCIVSDYDMPETDGLTFLQQVRSEDEEIPFILFTGKGSEEIASDAISEGVTDYLQKGSGTDKYELLANRIENVVEQYRAELALEETQQRFSKLLGHSTDVISILDAQGTFQYLTPSSEQILGYKPEEMIGEQAFEFAHPDDRAEAVEKFFQAVDDPDVQPTVEFRFQRKDGSWIILESRGRNLLDDPHVEGFVVNSRDVTENRHREADLRDEQAFTQNMLDAIPDIFYVLDTDLNFLQWNERLVEVTGYTDEEIREMNSLEFIPEADRDEVRERVSTVLEEGSTGSFETSIVSKDGESIPHEINGHRVTDNEGNGLEIAGTIRDISERKAHEQELKNQNNGLDDITSIVSHDLRNPLHIAQDSLDMAKTECSSDHHDRLERALDRMDTLIQDMLTLARRGKIVDETERVDLFDIVEECWRNTPTDDAELRTDGELTIEADRQSLKQMLANLFRNAIEHGDGDMVIQVGTTEDAFFVEDNGPGVPEEDRERIFEAGYSTSAGCGGLGLAIVERIAHAHGFEITATTGSTGGARFEITGGMGESLREEIQDV